MRGRYISVCLHAFVGVCEEGLLRIELLRHTPGLSSLCQSDTFLCSKQQKHIKELRQSFKPMNNLKSQDDAV